MRGSGTSPGLARTSCTRSPFLCAAALRTRFGSAFSSPGAALGSLAETFPALLDIHPAMRSNQLHRHLQTDEPRPHCRLGKHRRRCSQSCLNDRLDQLAEQLRVCLTGLSLPAECGSVYSEVLAKAKARVSRCDPVSTRPPATLPRGADRHREINKEA